jgi:serine/threonine protein phosphatase PrpC
MRFLPGNAQHIGSRHSQQDSFGFGDPDDAEFLSHGGFLAVVCDGMGGMEYGDAASRTAVRAFLEAYRHKSSEESIPGALERSVLEANHQVVSLAHRLGMSEGIGTTLVAVALYERSMYFISVGDSGVYVASGGDLRMVNHPHVFANMLDKAVARGAISREDALAHPERESLTSFIGAEVLEEIDRNVEPFPMIEGDTILLASDGMFKTLAHAEIAGSRPQNPQAWPETLVELTLSKKREFQDNVTVLSVTVAGDEIATMPRTVALPRTISMRDPEIPPAPLAPDSLPVAVEWAPIPLKAKSPGIGWSSIWVAILVLCLSAAAAGWWYARRASAQVPTGPVSAPVVNPIPIPTDSPRPASQMPSGEMKGPPK